MAQTKRPPWLIVLPVLFALTSGLAFGVMLAFAELAEIQDWDDNTVQTMSVIFETLGVLSLVLFAEWARLIAERVGYGLVGILGIVSLFIFSGGHMLFVTGHPLPVFVAGWFAVVYAFELRRYQRGGFLRSSEVSE